MYLVGSLRKPALAALAAPGGAALPRRMVAWGTDKVKQGRQGRPGAFKVQVGWGPNHGLFRAPIPSSRPESASRGEVGKEGVMMILPSAQGPNRLRRVKTGKKRERMDIGLLW